MRVICRPRPIVTVCACALVATVACSQSHGATSDAAPADARRLVGDASGDVSVGDTLVADGGAGDAARGNGCATTRGAGDTQEHVSQLVRGTPQDRPFEVHVPPSYKPGQATGVVVLLHAFTESARFFASTSGMNALSDANGFIAVYPQGLDDGWNAGTCCGFASNIAGADDVGFIRAVIDRVSSELCVDPRRVFVAGHDNGAMMAQRLACELSNRIAAVASIDGLLAVPSCVTPRPVPVMLAHGTADTWASLQRTVSDTIATWLSNDGCSDAKPAVVYDAGGTQCVEYSACKSGSALRHCTTSSAGYTWTPGAAFDVGAQITAFFAAHPMATPMP